MEEFGHDLIPDTTELIQLEEPDVDQMRRDRNDRTRSVMEAFSPSLAKTVLPKIDNLSLEERSAICIQAYYRGHQGRRRYFDVLYDHFEKEEAMRLEKTMKQIEEGELLVENHQLTVELEDNSTARRNKSRNYLDKVIVIQRAWRQYRLRQAEADDEEEDTYSRNLPSPPPSELEEFSEIDSLNGNQAMSISTNEGSLRNLHPEDEILTEFDATARPEHDHIAVPRDTDSVLSDYSEMADPLKEHFDEQDVKIIKMEDLEAGNTMYPATELPIKRSPDESDEEYNKRVKKMNYLSLAQEFAELKKVNADALPFDMHKGQTYEVMSSDEEDYCSSEGGSSELPTPCASEKPFGYFGELESPDTENMENFNQRTYGNKNLHNERKSWPTKPDSEMDYRNHNQHDSNTTSDTWSANEEYHYKDTTLPANATQLDDLPKNMRYQKYVQSQEEYEKRAHSDGSSPNQETADFDVYNIENTLQHMDWATFEKQLQRVAESEEQKTGKSRRNDREEIRRKLAMGADEEYYGGERAFKKPNLQTRLQSGMNLQICFMNDSTSDQESVDSETDTTRSSPRHIPSTMKTRQYSELTKPMQLCFINDLPSDDEDDRSESTLQDAMHDTPTASEDESQTKYLESDEEHPYVKFDSNGDLELRKDSQDFTDSVEEHDNKETDRLLKDSSPDFPEEPDGLAEIFKKIKSDRVLKHGEYRSLMVDYIFEQPETPEPKQLQPPPKASQPPPRPMSEGDADLYMAKKPEEGSDDFLSRQARLQAEARMALAQVRPMAHMQLEVEKQSRKKSPMAEMVGIPGFIGNGRRKKLTKGLMFDMNIAQLQVLVNDLHSQIETLNEELVTMLVERDDLHMEQDSMLVDIEDLTRHFSLRRAQVEYAQKLCDQKLQKRQAKRNNSTSSAVTTASSASTRKK